jgi:hypothetical protein
MPAAGAAPPATLTAADAAFVGRVAARVVDSGLVTPAVFFLEMAKPLALLSSHTLIFFGPIVTAFVHAEGYYRAAQVFEEPAHVEWLLLEIERIDRERRHPEEARGEG